LAEKNPLPKPKLEFYTLLTENHHPQEAEHAIEPNLPAKPVLHLDIKPMALAVNPTPSASPTHKAAITAPAPLKQQRTAAVVARKSIPAPTVRPTVPVHGVARYLIQVAAVRTAQDAERLRATLQLKGFAASIHASGAGSMAWFRVMIGPFNSRGQAEYAQVMLARREHINGIIRLS
jgi:cell division protein FtsN